MKAQELMRKAAAPYLRPGETIQQVFPAGTKSVAQLIAFGVIWNKYRIFVVTPQRILVLDGGHSQTRAKGLLTELPRGTRLGPAGGGVTHTIVVNGEKLHVGRLFFKDVNAADSQIPEFAN